MFMSGSPYVKCILFLTDWELFDVCLLQNNSTLNFI